MNQQQPNALTVRNEPVLAGAQSAGGEFLSFHLGAEEYGIDILKVQEIRGYEAPTRIANAPAYILGVLNLRGVIVPILDMRIKFGLSTADYNAQTVTIVLTIANRVVGMVVDSVSDVIALQTSQIRPAPEFSAAIDMEHVIGLGVMEQGDRRRMLILMDIERLMTSAEMGLISAPDLQ
ncbi:chemotaxis protein CheW [Roseateles violae]|uniref:Chemotaxis protein CheW n=1 Tax=Roseateles violae TaxID=3058042 RepID=A0ABT8DWJ0_9BURK|nr:chemotaxis protein CheW [Pelomonas sp. PFR6]MDN3920762.1 chemotaxis protein CheW [Pelomonas sp. PFR6]